jgi:hypothetical protein
MDAETSEETIRASCIRVEWIHDGWTVLAFERA